MGWGGVGGGGGGGGGESNVFLGSAKRFSINEGFIGDGTTNNAQAFSDFLSTVGTSVTTLYFKAGRYRVNSNITLTKYVTLEFEPGAVLDIPDGVTVTINGPIVAGFTRIFNFVGTGTGLVKGSSLVQHLNVMWYGATNDRSSDSTTAFRKCMEHSNFKIPVFLPPGAFLITDTVQCKAPRIYGVTFDVGGGHEGTSIEFRPTLLEDLKPCLLFDAGPHIQVENLKIYYSAITYTRFNVGTYVNAALMVQQDYAAFAPGYCGVKITGSCDINMDNVVVSGFKANVVFQNNVGHISLHRCYIGGGLIALFIAKNTGDYYLTDCTLSGSLFCNILLSRDGMGATLRRVHLGFAPYGIFQCNFVSPGGGNTGIEGCTFDDVRFEKIGECAIKMLPDKPIKDSTIYGFGLTWSSFDTNDSWFTAFPEGFIPERQLWAMEVGSILNSTILGKQVSGLFSSSYNPNGKTLRVHDTIWGTNDLSGIDFTRSEIKNINSIIPSLTIRDVYNKALVSASSSAFKHGQMLNNVHQPSSWTILNGTVEEVPLGQVLDGPGAMFDFYGPDMKVFKITPTGGAAPEVRIVGSNANTRTYTAKHINIRFWAKSDNTVFISGRFFDAASGTKYLYSKFYTTKGAWLEVIGEGRTIEPSPCKLAELTIRFTDTTKPTYFTMPMMSENDLLPFALHYHDYIRLTAPNGTVYQMYINDAGQLTVGLL